MGEQCLVVDLSKIDGTLSDALDRMNSDLAERGIETVVFRGKDCIPDAFVYALRSKGFTKRWSVFGSKQKWCRN